MKDYLKYISIIIVCVTTIVISTQIRSCSNVRDGEESVTVTPRDSSFVPVSKNEYRPRSTPFEKDAAIPARLPNDAPQANVARTIAIVKAIPADGTGTFIKDSTNIVITKSGDVFVEKKSGIETNVTITEFLPPILQWDFYCGIGFNTNMQKIFPSVSVSFLQINEKFSAPILFADTRSIGVGAGYKFYYDISVAPVLCWDYENLNRSIKINVSYQL